MELTVRKEMTGDEEAIHGVIVAAFREVPYSSHTEQHIVRALREADALTVSLVAETNGDIVGHVAISPVQISDGATGWFGLGPISVVPEWQGQGQGIGSRLMTAALTQLREQGAAGCVLLGDPAFYRRFGFETRAELVLPGVPPEYFQALSFDGSRPRGEVIYHAAFDRTE